MSETITKEFSWKDYINRVEARGYEFLSVGPCPNCGGKACQVHNDGVIHSKCENGDFNNTGFGGPNVRSWEEAVTFDNLSTEERDKQKEQAKKKIDDKQNRLKAFLLGGE